MLRDILYELLKPYILRAVIMAVIALIVIVVAVILIRRQNSARPGHFRAQRISRQGHSSRVARRRR